MGSQSRTWQHTRMHPNGIISIKIQPYLTCFVKLFFFFFKFPQALKESGVAFFFFLQINILKVSPFLIPLKKSTFP